MKANFEKNACFKSIGDKAFDLHQKGVADKAELAKNVLYSPYAHVESGFKDDEKVEKSMDALDFIRKV